MSKLIHVAIKVEKCQVVDTIAFEKEGGVRSVLFTIQRL